jgi:hypothetical protein
MWGWEEGVTEEQGIEAAVLSHLLSSLPLVCFLLSRAWLGAQLAGPLNWPLQG